MGPAPPGRSWKNWQDGTDPLQTALPAHADWNPTTGTNEYNTAANWDLSTIDDVFSRAFTGIQVATFDNNRTLSSDWKFTSGAAFGLPCVESRPSGRPRSAAWSALSLWTPVTRRYSTMASPEVWQPAVWQFSSRAQERSILSAPLRR